MLGIGGCGMMITASNVAPRMVSQLYNAFASRDLDGAITDKFQALSAVSWRSPGKQPDPCKVHAQALGSAE